MGFVTDWQGGGGMKRALLRIDEVCQILSCSRRHVYDLLCDGKIQAHNPSGRPGSRGTKILAVSVETYVATGTIPAEEWTK